MRTLRRLTVLLAISACVDDVLAPGVVQVAVDGPANDTAWVGAPGEPLPDGVRLRIADDRGHPIPGATLVWDVVGRDASVIAATPQSSSSGEATAQWVLGTDAAEEQRLEVTVYTPRYQGQLIVRARAVAHVVSQLRVVIDTPAVLRLGDTLPVQVDAIDPYGNVFPAPEVTLSLVDSALGAAAGPGIVGGPRRGRSAVRVASHGVATTFPLQVTQYVAAIVPVRDTIRFSSLGAELPVEYAVRDDRGRVVADTAAVVTAADTALVQVTGGRIRSLARGATTLHLALDTAAATISVGVSQRVASLALVRDTIHFHALLDTTTLRPIARDSLGSDIPQPALTYAVSDGQVAKLTAGQTLQAVTPGAAVVTVRDAETGIATTAQVVVRQRIAAIELAPAQIVLDALGDTLSLAATARDRLGSVVTGAILDYSVSDPTVLVLESGAQLRSVGPGHAVVTARDPQTGTVGTAEVSVAQRITSIALTPNTVAFDALGDTASLQIVARDRLGEVVTGASLSLSVSDSAVAAVLPGSRLRSVRPGVAVVGARDPATGTVGTASVTVVQRVTSVELFPDTVVFDALGDTATLLGLARDRLGAVVAGAGLDWGVSDTGVVAILGNGRLAAVRPGQAQVTARDPATGTIGTGRVTVDQRIASITLAPGSVLFDALGDTLTVRLVARDRLGAEVAGPGVEFLVDDTTVVSLQAGLRLRSVGPGSAQLTARDTLTGTVGLLAVTVAQRVAGLSLAPDSVVFDALGATTPLVLQGWDRLGAQVADPRVTYSSTDPAVATVTPDGFAGSASNGSALVIAQSADGPADSIQVTVAQQVTGIVLGRDSLVFESLRAVQAVQATPVDRLGVPVPAVTLRYAVEDSTVASADSNGEVLALANGTTRLYVLAAADTGVLAIRVAQRPVRLKLSPDTLRFSAVGDTAELAAIAVDSLGFPITRLIENLDVTDRAKADVVDGTHVRSQGDGVTAATFTVAGLPALVPVVVSQEADSIVAALAFPKPIVTLAVGATVPLNCQAFDRNGYSIPRLPFVISHGTVSDGPCDAVLVQRSGYDTLLVSMGTGRAYVPIVVAASVTVSSRSGEFLRVDSLPSGMFPWAPSARTTSNGQLEVYFAAYPDDTTLFKSGDLHRLVSSDGVDFRYDGVALRHDSTPCSPDGSGIENVVVVPRPEAPGWRMFYSGGSWGCYEWQVLSAVSSDERTWAKEPGVRLSNGGAVPPAPPGGALWPTGEGMSVRRTANGEWHMTVGSFEHISPIPVDQWQITEWSSSDQIQWTYLGTVLTTRDMPPGGRGSVYSPTIREFAPGLWRMIFTADDRGSGSLHSALWSAVSLDHVNWQIEGEVLSDVGVNLYYAAAVGDRLVFLRSDSGQFTPRLAIATVQMP